MLVERNNRDGFVCDGCKRRLDSVGNYHQINYHLRLCKLCLARLKQMRDRIPFGRIGAQQPQQ